MTIFGGCCISIFSGYHTRHLDTQIYIEALIYTAMAETIRQFFIGRDIDLTRRILLVAGVLSLVAFSTLAIPTLWERYGSAGGAETMQLATAGGFVISVIAAVYVLAQAGEINPYVPAAAVLVVLASYAVTGIVTDVQLVFLLGPSIFLGILASLAAYANDGSLAALSLVFFPVCAYMLNAPSGFAEGLLLVDRFRFAVLFSFLFTFSIGIAGFLIGVTFRRVVDYANLLSIETLEQPEDTE